MGDLTRLGVCEAADLLARRELSSVELVTACLERIHAVDGTHSHEGDPGSINAWVRVYEEDALAAAAGADERRASEPESPSLLGVPLGLKDLFGVAGKPVTASSSLLHDVPDRDCDAWAQLREAGMVLLGHLHTHEFAAGGTTDQVGSPWALDRSAGGSSGGSSAALAARMVPAATGTDTAGSVRIPSACSGTSAIKPTKGSISLAGVVPLAWSLDTVGPMARSVADCRVLLEALVGPDRGRAESALHRGVPETPGSLAGTRIALSPRLADAGLDPDVEAGFERAVAAVRELGGVIVEPPLPETGTDVGQDFLDVLTTEMRAYHRRFDDHRELYRDALREWVELGERRNLSAEEYVLAQQRRNTSTSAWADWLGEHRVTAILEPTIPNVAPLRGEGYQHAGSDADMISLTHLWAWTGFPAVALPSAVGAAGLPVGVSLIGAAGTDWELAALGIELQEALGVPEPPELG